MGFFIGDTYGGLQSAALAGAGQDASNYFNLAHLNQQDYQNQFQAQQAQQALADAALARDTAARQWDFKSGMETRAANLADRKQAFDESKDTPLDEKKREFDFRRAADMARDGLIDDPKHALKLFPNLEASDAASIAAQSKQARGVIDATVAPLQDAADTLNEALQLQESGSPSDWEDTAARAAKVMSDKGLMQSLRRNGQGLWEPVTAPRPWAATGPRTTTGLVDGAMESGPIEGGFEKAGALDGVEDQASIPSRNVEGGFLAPWRHPIDDNLVMAGARRLWAATHSPVNLATDATAPPSAPMGKVMMVSSKGVRGLIPAAQVKAALAEGYTMP